ncbi:MAG: hypothetical protein H6Q65_78 [Firmicutes bacterium]|nr:hypothetical protein [Bacillota bacterium]
MLQERRSELTRIVKLTALAPPLQCPDGNTEAFAGFCFSVPIFLGFSDQLDSHCAI